MELTVEKKAFHSIDLCKLLMSFCVVATHTNPLYNCKNIIALNLYNSLVTMAVPFFFLASGFFLGQKMEYPFCFENSINKIKQYLLKITKLYLIWNIVYLPLAIYEYIQDKTSVFRSFLIYLRGLFFIGEHYNSWILWYLLSTIYTLIIILILMKLKVKPKRMIMVGIALYIFGMGISYLLNYEGQMSGISLIIQKLFRYSIGSGRIFSGFLYIPIGMILSKRKISKKIAWIMLLGGLFLNICIKNESITSILLAISTIGLFIVVEDIRLRNSKVFSFLRKMSTVIYFIHLYVWTCYYCVIYKEKTYGMDSFFVTLIISILIAILYILIKNEIKFIKKSKKCVIK